MSRAEYLRREIEIAVRNARGADHAGDYQAAAWWEARAQELRRELEGEDEQKSAEPAGDLSVL